MRSRIIQNVGGRAAPKRRRRRRLERHGRRRTTTTHFFSSFTTLLQKTTRDREKDRRGLLACVCTLWGCSTVTISMLFFIQFCGVKSGWVWREKIYKGSLSFTSLTAHTQSMVYYLLYIRAVREYCEHTSPKKKKSSLMLFYFTRRRTRRRFAVAVLRRSLLFASSVRALSFGTPPFVVVCVVR